MTEWSYVSTRICRRSGQAHFSVGLGLLCLLAFTTLAGCCYVPGGGLRDWWRQDCKVGPNYSRPPAPVACDWIDYADPRVRSGEQRLCQWWTVFNDPVLDALVHTAYEQNLTLRTAGARILEARAIRGIAAGNMFHQFQQVFFDYSRVKLSEESANPQAETSFSNWDTGFAASWEIDFWGRYRRAVEAADAQLDASIEDYDDVLVVLLSDVAANYVQYRTFQQRLLYARQNIEIQSKSFRIASEKFDAGATVERDIHQAKQVLAQTESLIPALEIGRRLAANRLCVLLGMPVMNLDTMLGEDANIPVAPREVVVGMPADLLRRRPDIRREERRVAAQSARIGIAVSDLYPHISLVGTIGVEAEEFGDLFNTPASLIGTAGPSIRWDVLNYGRLVNNVRVQDARFQELAYAYQERVLSAGREVEDAIVAFLRTQEQADHLNASVDAAEKTVEITTEQYGQGAVDFTSVFIFQSSLTGQQDQLAVAQGSIALSLIAVYRALGGGWQIRLSSDAAEQHIIERPILEDMPPPTASHTEIRAAILSSGPDE